MSRTSIVRWSGLIAGPVLALFCFQQLPTEFHDAGGTLVEFTFAGRATLAVMIWMAAWWLTAAIDISATALLPVVLFPLLGIAGIGDVTASYGSDVIFLFLGGFILALAIQRWGLDKRIALFTLRRAGTRPPALIGGFMFVTAFMSMWVSNTATAAMMLPIALSVIDLLMRQRTGKGLDQRGGFAAADPDNQNFALAVLLGIAYAASIGGVGTIIGSPPNGILVRFVEQTYGQSVSFADWMLIGGPFVAVFLPMAWLIVTRVLFPVRLAAIAGSGDLIENEYRRLGRLTMGERLTLGVFGATVSAWIFRPLLIDLEIYGLAPLANLTDAGIAMIAALAVFVLPVKPRECQFVMDWSTAERLPWGVLILFGGGLALAAAVQANGVAEFLGAQATALAFLPPVLVVMGVTLMIIFLTELTSNTATTATMVPVLAALAPGLGVAPSLLIVPCTIAASCAFMMPVATPPNAIVFGSGFITIGQMCKAGFWLNLLGVTIITLVGYTIVLSVVRF